MELHLDAMLCSNIGNKNSDAGHIKCSHRPQVPHTCSNGAIIVSYADEYTTTTVPMVFCSAPVFFFSHSNTKPIIG